VGRNLRRIGDLSPDQRPRERLRRLGSDALTDAEVLAVLIGSGRPGRNAIDLAHELISHVGGMAELGRATADDIERLPGLGPAAAARIVAATELRRRAALAQPAAGISGSAGVAAVVLPHLRDRHRERMVVAVLDRRLRVLDVVSLGEGTTAHTAAPVAEVLQTVFSRGGQAFALAHNHPGGSLDPSAADRQATKRIRAAAEACGLRFLDHLIVAGDRWRAI
jgi:DNA repair protein RadC